MSANTPASSQPSFPSLFSSCSLGVSSFERLRRSTLYSHRVSSFTYTIGVTGVGPDGVGMLNLGFMYTPLWPAYSCQRWQSVHKPAAECRGRPSDISNPQGFGRLADPDWCCCSQ